MAGDWIKFEVTTSDKPEVWEIATSLNIDPDAVVGKLLRIWSWFDQQTEKGNAKTVTKMLLDRTVGVTGFCNAVINAGWMTESDGSITLPQFDKHNGQTAKNRALTARRVAKSKSKGNGGSNDKVTVQSLPREDKREDIKESKPKGLQRNGFTPPSIDELVAEFSGQVANPMAEAVKFFNHYDSKNWFVGKNKMSKWKSSVAGWIARSNENAGSQRTVGQASKSKSDLNDEATRKFLAEAIPDGGTMDCLAEHETGALLGR